MDNGLTIAYQQVHGIYGNRLTIGLCWTFHGQRHVGKLQLDTSLRLIDYRKNHLLTLHPLELCLAQDRLPEQGSKSTQLYLTTGILTILDTEREDEFYMYNGRIADNLECFYEQANHNW